MYTSIELLDSLKATYGLTSDYALAKKLGVKTQTISSYRTRRSFFDDKMSFQIAHLLDLDPADVIASANLERAEKYNNETLVNFWREYAH